MHFIFVIPTNLHDDQTRMRQNEFKPLLALFVLLGLLLSGCKTTETAKPETAQTQTAAASKSKPGKAPGTFSEPDDSWTYLRVSVVDSERPGNLAEGYVAIAPNEFRLLLKGQFMNLRVDVSGNKGKISINGQTADQWSGTLDSKTPVGLQPFFMLSQSFDLARAYSMESKGVRLSFRGLDPKVVETAELYFGEQKSGRFYPSDIAINYEKTQMQISLLIEE